MACRRRRFLAALTALILAGLTVGLTLSLPSSGGGTSGAFAATGNSSLSIPQGANGIAVIVYGRLLVTTKTGFHLDGLPVTAASLSPNARYVAAGTGNSLAELAPSGKRVWSRPVGERVAQCGAQDSRSTIPGTSRLLKLR